MSTDDNAMEQDDMLDPDGDDRDEDNGVDDEVDVNDGDDGNGDDDDDGAADGADDHDSDNENGDVRPNDNEEEDDEEDDEEGDNDEGDDDASLTEGDEDLEAAVKTINERARRGHAVSSGFDTTTASELHVTADDFIRNFLSQLKMTATLDKFQTEWTEMAQKGLLNTKRFGEVPDVYVQNQRLHNELKNALREREEYQLAASTSADTLARAQKARDTQWMKRKRAGQENNRLLEEMRRLKAQCHASEPAIRRMDDKFQVLVEQTMRAALERDKVVNLAQSQPCPPTVQRDNKAQKTNNCIKNSHRCSKML
ncbi:sperm-associated antigen 16 protein-like [Vanacampus margaritifer]